jgi:ABA4-like protein
VSTIFSLLSLAVAPLWLAMMLAPRAAITRKLVASPWCLVPIAIAYVALVVPELPTVLPMLMRPQLPEIAALLGSERGATIAWAHFLAFDAFVGRWIHSDALARGVPGWLLAPILFCTLMVGPLGLTLWLLVRPRGAVVPT